MSKPKNPEKKVVEAEELVLKSRDGKVLARIGEEEGGGVAFRLYDANGVERYFIGLGPEGNPIVAMTDEKESPRLTLSHTVAGTAIEIRDENKKVRAKIGFDGQNMSFLTLGGTQSSTQLLLWADEDSSKVALNDPQGRLRLGLVSDMDGKPAVVTEDLGNILNAFQDE